MTETNRVVEISNEAENAGRRDLVALAIDAIKGRIRRDGLMAGDLLPGEGRFVEELGVSRVVVREAFRSLSALGLIDVGNGRRARVAAVDSTVLSTVVDHAVHLDQVSIQQIYDLRRTLEARTVALAAMRRSDAEAGRIVELADLMLADFNAGDRQAESIMEDDIAFHKEIAAAARNPAFALVLGGFEQVMRQTWPIGWRSRASDELRRESIETHRRIASAIRAGEPIIARERMDIHFDSSIRALIDAGLL